MAHFLKKVVLKQGDPIHSNCVGGGKLILSRALSSIPYSLKINREITGKDAGKPSSVFLGTIMTGGGDGMTYFLTVRLFHVFGDLFCSFALFNCALFCLATEYLGYFYPYT